MGTNNSIQSYNTVLKKPLSTLSFDKTNQENNKVLINLGHIENSYQGQMPPFDIIGLIRNEVMNIFNELNIVERIQQLEQENSRMKDTLQDITNIEEKSSGNFKIKYHQEQESMNQARKESINKKSYNDKSTKSIVSDNKLLQKNFDEHIIYGNNTIGSQPQTSRIFMQSTGNLADFSLSQDNRKLVQLKDNLKHVSSPNKQNQHKMIINSKYQVNGLQTQREILKKDKLQSPKQTFQKQQRNQNLQQKNNHNSSGLINNSQQSISNIGGGDGLIFKSMQTISALSNKNLGMASSYNNINFTTKTKNKSPVQRLNKKVLSNDNTISREQSLSQSNHISELSSRFHISVNKPMQKNDKQRMNKNKVLSMNSNTISLMCADVKKQKTEIPSKSLQKYQQHVVKNVAASQQFASGLLAQTLVNNQNNTYFSSSINSNYMNYNNNSVNHRTSQARSSLTNENDNTTPFNFSGDHLKFNTRESKDGNTQLDKLKQFNMQKLDAIVNKPQTSSFTHTPSEKKRQNHILVQLSSQSARTVKMSSPQSNSPTTKKSHISTLEEHTLDLQIRSIGQSLTDRLNQNNIDKKTKFNSSTNGIQNILQFVRQNEKECNCCRRSSIQGGSLNSSRRQSGKIQYGIHSTLVTPSRDDSHSIIQNENPSQQHEQACGDLCFKTFPQRQKEIIKGLMKKEYGNDLKIFVNKADFGFPNERKYIIESKWWRKWCDYTGFEIQQDQDFCDNQVIKDNSFRLFQSQSYDSIESDKPLNIQFNMMSDRNKLLGLNKNSKSTQRINTRYQNGIFKKQIKQTKNVSGNSKIQLLDFEKKSIDFNQNLEMLRQELNSRKNPKINNISKSVQNKKELFANTLYKGQSEQIRNSNLDYKNPGKIKNIVLVDQDSPRKKQSSEGNLIKLKNNLIEYHDFEAVSSEIWKYISSWYKYDLTLARYLQFDNKSERTFLQLYPQSQF
eukprot:403331254